MSKHISILWRQPIPRFVQWLFAVVWVDVFSFKDLHCFPWTLSSLIKIMFALALFLFIPVWVDTILCKQSMFLGCKHRTLIIVAVLLKLIDWHVIMCVWSGLVLFSARYGMSNRSAIGIRWRCWWMNQSIKQLRNWSTWLNGLIDVIQQLYCCQCMCNASRGLTGGEKPTQHRTGHQINKCWKLI